MKLQTNTTLLVLIFAGTALVTVGCTTMSHLLGQPGSVEQLAPQRTNYLTQVTTNYETILPRSIPVQTVTRTNADGTVSTITLPPQVIGPVTRETYTTNVVSVILPAVYFTNQVLSPGVTSAIQGAGQLAGAAGIPWTQTAAGALLAAAGLFVTWNNRRQKQSLLDQLDDHKDQLSNVEQALETAQTVAGTLVDNFESLRKVALTIPGYTPDLDHKVMDAVKTAQAFAGVKSEIHDLVEQHTGDTIEAKN
ncbi:MAG: hypothetical protein JWQ71_4474 [Pedosphaera sp.]|nr:hypothetical protein [Pedosphaera sp.]